MVPLAQLVRAVRQRGKKSRSESVYTSILLDFSLTVRAATLTFISGCGSAISSAKQGKSGFIHNLVKN